MKYKLGVNLLGCLIETDNKVGKKIARSYYNNKTITNHTSIRPIQEEQEQEDILSFSEGSITDDVKKNQYKRSI